MSRVPTNTERQLLQRLAELWAEGPQRWVDQVRVQALDDGAMGSLRLLLGQPDAGQVFGRQVAEYQFTDTDGVKVIASLNVDQHGVPFELDVWKVDFTATNKLKDSGLGGL
jgi:hypothetical protein